MSVKKILFLGTHGQYNIGDELLLETFLSQLGNRHEYTVNTYDEKFTLRQVGDQYKLKVFHTTQKRWHILLLPDQFYRSLPDLKSYFLADTL